MYSIPGYVDFELKGDTISIIDHLTKNVIEVNASNKKELFSIYNSGSIAIRTDLEKFLFQHGVLDEKAKLAAKVNAKLESLSNKLNVTIMITELCNFNCKYCYERKNPKAMSDEMMRSIVNFISKQVEEDKKLKAIHITWIGGEPLLEKTKILKYGKMIKDLAESHGLKHSAEISTNGYFLDEEVFGELLTVGIRKYSIALDGKTHDYLRPLITGEGTSKAIFRNLIAIKKHYDKTEDFEIEIINNILENNRDFIWYDKLKILIGDPDHFVFVVKTIDQLRKDYDAQNTANIVKRNKLLKEHYEYLEFIHMRTDRKSSSEYGLCKAGLKNGFVFRCDGLVVKCNSCLSYDFNNVGLIGYDDIKIDAEKNSKWTHKIDHESCISCKNVLKCGYNSCPKTRFNSQKCINFSRRNYETI